MSVRYAFEGNLFRMTMEGSYSPEDVIETYKKALDDPAFPGDARFLFDVRESTVLAGRDPEEIRGIAEFLARHSEKVGGRCAIVASTPVHRGLSLMGATFADFMGATVEVFADPTEAIAWLGAEVEK